MSQSATASFVVWVISVVIAIFLLIRKRNYDVWNGIFILTFSFVEFLEGGLWLFLNNGDVESVSLLTSVLLIALWFAPFVQSYAGYYYVTQRSAVLWQEIILVIMAILYTGIIAYVIVRAFDPETLGILRNQRLRVKVGSHGQLVWVDEASSGSFVDGGIAVLTILYLIGLFVPLFFMGYRGLILVTVGLVSLGIIYWLYSAQEVGSSWAGYFILLYGIVALLL